jgi:hypothetical protein
VLQDDHATVWEVDLCVEQRRCSTLDEAARLLWNMRQSRTAGQEEGNRGRAQLPARYIRISRASFQPRRLNINSLWDSYHSELRRKLCGEL